MEAPSPFPRVTPTAIRRNVLEQAKRANVGHIGSALSVADIMAVLFSGRLDRAGSGAGPGARDRFVLSKGHAALALYAALHLQGRIDKAVLDTYCGNGSHLGVHPEKGLPGIDFSTGSLGQGLSMGAGAALAMKLKGAPGRVRVLMSDAELNEGSTWEAAMFAAHRKLGNLDLILDLNGQQALGHTRDVLDLDPLRPRWEAFGWDVREADGHDAVSMQRHLESMAEDPHQPSILIARTVCGKGVSFMESQVKWHYWPMSDAQYAEALAELERAA
ncbi:MAG TPA: transketolase [Fibrobacteria bacterium]|nr:transketolase [Fibrobacteria bacterium]